MEAFAKAIRAKLDDSSSTFAKDYLTALVDEIRDQQDRDDLRQLRALTWRGGRQKSGR